MPSAFTGHAPVRRLFAVLGWLCLSSQSNGILCQNTNAEWEQLTEQVQQMFAAGRYTAGERIARKAVGVAKAASPVDNGKVAASLTNLAELLRMQRRYKEASQALAEARQLANEAYGAGDPAVAAIVNAQAALARSRGFFKEAERLYRECLAIDEAALGPRDPNVARDLNNLASLLIAARRYREAQPLVERAALVVETALGGEHPYLAMSLRNLAATRYALGNHAEALAAQTRAVTILRQSLGESHPEYIEAARELQRVNASGSPEMGESVAALESAVKAHPADIPARLRLGAYYDKQARYADARQQFEAVLAVDGGVREAWEYLALIHEFEQNTDKAIAAYTKAIELERKSAEPSEKPSLNLGILMGKLHRYQEAIPLFQEAASKAPGSAVAQRELGRVLLQAKQPGQAIEHLKTAAKLDPEHARVHYFLGQAYQSMNQPELASASFSRFKELERKSATTSRSSR